jgi:hypothetical protein
VIRGIGELAGQLNKIPGFKNAGIEDYIQLIPILGSYINLLAKAGQVAGGSGVQAQGLADLARLQSQFTIKTLAAKKKITAEESKALKAARLKAALEKANLALLKGEEVFDMDKIQNEAALANQAEQLGKATNGSQILQIANDTARLNVKKSILALEDAMASKDEAAITAATAKLNADLGILAAMTGQDAKLVTIKSILDTLKPKDLINLDNLREALALLKQIALGSGSTGSSLAAPSMPKSLQPRPMGAGYLTGPKTFSNEELQYFEAVSEYQFSGMLPPASSSGSTAGNTIIVNTGIGDPNAIAEAIDQVLTDAVQRGTLRGTFATP